MDAGRQGADWPAAPDARRLSSPRSDDRVFQARRLRGAALCGARVMTRLAVLMRRSAGQAKLVFYGALFVLSGLQIIIVGQASGLEDTRAFSRMGDMMPAFLQRGLGNHSLLLMSFKGMVAFGYFHPVVGVLISILAVYFVTEPAYEVESGLVDLTLARSIPRHAVVTRSILLAAAATALAAVSMFAG